MIGIASNNEISLEQVMMLTICICDKARCEKCRAFIKSQSLTTESSKNSQRNCDQEITP